jgi:hypothetical protein
MDTCLSDIQEEYSNLEKFYSKKLLRTKEEGKLVID